MLSQPVTAAEAEGLNLVAKVVPDGELDTTATGLARRLADGPSHAYAAVKSLVKAQASAGAAADTLLPALTTGPYETADARAAIPKVGAALTADKPLSQTADKPLPDNVKFIGS